MFFKDVGGGKIIFCLGYWDEICFVNKIEYDFFTLKVSILIFTINFVSDKMLYMK